MVNARGTKGCVNSADKINVVFFFLNQIKPFLTLCPPSEDLQNRAHVVVGLRTTYTLISMSLISASISLTNPYSCEVVVVDTVRAHPCAHSNEAKWAQKLFPTRTHSLDLHNNPLVIYVPELQHLVLNRLILF